MVPKTAVQQEPKQAQEELCSNHTRHMPEKNLRKEGKAISLRNSQSDYTNYPQAISLRSTTSTKPGKYSSDEYEDDIASAWPHRPTCSCEPIELFFHSRSVSGRNGHAPSSRLARSLHRSNAV
jgi:hypothetical protein